MQLYIGSDHRGFKLKEDLKVFLKNKGYAVADLGNDHLEEDDDYPDFAYKVGKKVSEDYENARGVLICGSGVGVDVVANKFENVRSALIGNPNQAFDSRNDDDANVISLGANYLDLETAKKILTVWLETPFSEDPRHTRRVQKIFQIESKTLKLSNED